MHDRPDRPREGHQHGHITLESLHDQLVKVRQENFHLHEHAKLMDLKLDWLVSHAKGEDATKRQAIGDALDAQKAKLAAAVQKSTPTG